MTQPPTYPTQSGKVTLLKRSAGVGLLIIIIGAGIFLLNKKDDESVKALDANPSPVSESSEDPLLGTYDVDSDSDRSADCTDGSDCDDQDDRANQPSSQTDTSAPTTNNDAQSQTDLAIEEEGIPAVDEKPAKSN